MKHFLETQARTLADALIARTSPRCALPCPTAWSLSPGEVNQAKPTTLTVPANEREQMAGGLIDRMTRADVNTILSERLAELENSPNQAVSVSAGLIRYSTASHMVNAMLPSGRSVTYQATEGEEIPSQPVVDGPGS